MKQVIQDLRRGDVRVAEVPPPLCLPQGVLVRSVVSLISSGTERAALRLGNRTLLGKALERPDLVRRAWRQLKTTGLADVVANARARLQGSQPLGYSAAGVVVEVGRGAEEFSVGDAVACAGVGHACHAALNWIPKNLCVSIPPGVDFCAAASVALGSIALQGVRVAEVQIGERVAVVGLGLVGLLTAQIVKAAGCVVWGVDPDPERVKLARNLGVDTPLENRQYPEQLLNGAEGSDGMDAVILTAATRSPEPIELAGRLARDRGVVVVVGDVRVDVPRELYYRKELQVRYSRSYGPGRYDSVYEEGGADYPYGLVRWTENRNMRAYLELVAAQKVQVEPLVTHRFDVDKAAEAYELLSGRRREKHVGIILTYPHDALPSRVVVLDRPTGPAKITEASQRRVRIGWIGAGQFSRRRLLPALRKIPGVEFAGLANATGISAHTAAKDFGFRYYSTDASEIVDDPLIDVVFIGTRHASHAAWVVRALERGKHVFVEKPLCVNMAELERITKAHRQCRRLLTVGFNRRFSPFARECTRFFGDRREPLSVIYRVNAAGVPPSHWIFDPEQGHGRVIGEMCHFVDLIQYLTSYAPAWMQARSIGGHGNDSKANLHVQMGLADGSLGEIVYVSGGNLQVPKERVEVFGAGRTAICDDFRTLRFYQEHRCHTRSHVFQDKGHRDEVRAFLKSVVTGGVAPISFESLRATSLATFAIQESLSTGCVVPLHSSASGESTSGLHAAVNAAGAHWRSVC